jgi:hypothetical protein
MKYEEMETSEIAKVVLQSMDEVMSAAAGLNELLSDEEHDYLNQIIYSISECADFISTYWQEVYTLTL